MFRCKQFVVHQEKCAMKVNTDSLILGSWLNVAQYKTFLDVGTGTGILALMLAQKSVACAHIHAIDIEDNAVIQASENAQNSKWANKITVSRSALSQFHAPMPFELMVSNPPYFEGARTTTNAYSLQGAERRIARQTETLSPQTLLGFAAKHLTEDGQFYCMYPFSRETEIQTLAFAAGLHVKRLLRVRHSDVQAPYITLFCFIKAAGQTEVEALTIRDQTNQYTLEFKRLCRDFYLKF